MGSPQVWVELSRQAVICEYLLNLNVYILIHVGVSCAVSEEPMTDLVLLVKGKMALHSVTVWILSRFCEHQQLLPFLSIKRPSLVMGF